MQGKSLKLLFIFSGQNTNTIDVGNLIIINSVRELLMIVSPETWTGQVSFMFEPPEENNEI